MTAANIVAHKDRQRGHSNEDQHRQADIERKGHGHVRIPFATTRAMSCVTIAPTPAPISQTLTSFSAPSKPAGVRQQAQHDEAEAEIVDLGQRVQARQRVGKAEQSDRACHKKETCRPRPKGR